PDHVGMAGWLTRKFGIRLWMTRLEYLTCRVMVSDTGREAPEDAVEFCRRAGWSPAAIETYRARFGNFRKHIHPLPDSYPRHGHGRSRAVPEPPRASRRGGVLARRTRRRAVPPGRVIASIDEPVMQDAASELLAADHGSRTGTRSQVKTVESPAGRPGTLKL